MAKQSQIELNDAQIEKMSEDIAGMWKGLELNELQIQLNAQDLSRKDRELAEQKRANNIKLFEAQLKEKYPNIMNMAGKGVQDLTDFMDMITFDLLKTSMIVTGKQLNIIRSFLLC